MLRCRFRYAVHTLHAKSVLVNYAVDLYGYTPTELFRQPHSHGPAADWFAIDVTLHELVLGSKSYARLELADNTCVVGDLHNAPNPAFVRSDHPMVRARTVDLSVPCMSFMEHMLHSNVTYRIGSSPPMGSKRSRSPLRTIHCYAKTPTRSHHRFPGSCSKQNTPRLLSMLFGEIQTVHSNVHIGASATASTSTSTGTSTSTRCVRRAFGIRHIGAVHPPHRSEGF